VDDRRGLGRLARPVNGEGKFGPIFWLNENPPAPQAGFPEYPGASVPEFSALTEQINDYLAQPQHWPSWEFVNQQTRPKAADGSQLCEPTQAWTLKDGTRVRLFRDLGNKQRKREPSWRQYVQYSYDSGETWTPAVRTDFPDASARSAAGNLPDGTAYVINNPGSRGRRDPLVISLARDGLTFDRHAVVRHKASPPRHQGRWKSSGFQYPHATIMGDDLFVIYSIGKEDMAVTRIPLESLSKVPSAAGVKSLNKHHFLIWRNCIHMYYVLPVHCKILTDMTHQLFKRSSLNLPQPSGLPEALHSISEGKASRQIVAQLI
jgi:hypothetical protein